MSSATGMAPGRNSKTKQHALSRACLAKTEGRATVPFCDHFTHRITKRKDKAYLLNLNRRIAKRKDKSYLLKVPSRCKEWLSRYDLSLRLFQNFGTEEKRSFLWSNGTEPSHPNRPTQSSGESGKDSRITASTPTLEDYSSFHWQSRVPS